LNRSGAKESGQKKSLTETLKTVRLFNPYPNQTQSLNILSDRAAFILFKIILHQEFIPQFAPKG
jgi:hypothetical protein